MTRWIKGVEQSGLKTVMRLESVAVERENT